MLLAFGYTVIDFFSKYWILPWGWYCSRRYKCSSEQSRQQSLPLWSVHCREKPNTPRDKCSAFKSSKCSEAKNDMGNERLGRQMKSWLDVQGRPHWGHFFIRAKGSKGSGPTNNRQIMLHRGNIRCKTPEVVQGAASRPVGWRRMSRRQARDEVIGLGGQIPKGLVSHSEDFGFYSEWNWKVQKGSLKLSNHMAHSI